MEKTETKTTTRSVNALHVIQQELNAPKGQFNKFGNYNYRNCEDILEAVKPLLALTKSTLVVTDKPIQVGEWVFIEATATLTDNEGKSWSASASARHGESQPGMSAGQLTGSTSSYARKYCLSGLFAIDDTKDDDTRDNTQPAKKVSQTAPSDPTEAYEDTSLGLCRKCKSGHIVERTAKTTGKKFWGCSNFPKCDYVSWTKPETNPLEEIALLAEEF